MRCDLMCFSIAEFEVEAATIGDVKEQVEETMGVDVKEWRLFQFGFLLPDDPETGYVGKIVSQDLWYFCQKCDLLDKNSSKIKI